MRSRQQRICEMRREGECLVTMRSFPADFPAALALGPQSAWNRVPRHPGPRPEGYFKRWILPA